MKLTGSLVLRSIEKAEGVPPKPSKKKSKPTKTEPEPPKVEKKEEEQPPPSDTTQATGKPSASFGNFF